MVSKRNIAKGRTDPRVECGLKPWLGLNSSLRYQDLPVPRLWGNAPREPEENSAKSEQSWEHCWSQPEMGCTKQWRRWCSLPSSGAAWKSVELKSGVVYQLSGSLCTFWCNNDSGKRAGRFGELAAVYGSWVCTVQFAVCMVCLVQSALHCRAIGMGSIQRTQVNRTTQRANDAGLFCL